MTDVAETRDTERDGVRRTLDEVVAAWARADAPAFRACFTADAAYTTWFGETYRGPDEIAGVHQVLWAGPLAGTRLTAEVADLRFLTDEVAVVATRGDVVRGAGGSRRAAKTQTWVVVRDADRWRVAAFVNVRRHRALAWFTARTLCRSAARGSA